MGSHMKISNANAIVAAAAALAITTADAPFTPAIACGIAINTGNPGG